MANGLLGRVTAVSGDKVVKASRRAQTRVNALAQDSFARLELELDSDGRWTLTSWQMVSKNDVDGRTVEAWGQTHA